MATWGAPLSLKGVKGDAGLSVLSGHGAPASSLGYDGQVYIDVDAADLYLRTNGTWTKTVNLVGPLGMNGYSGQLLFGPNAPTSADYNGPGDALYVQANGKVWAYDGDGAKQWVDTGFSLLGPKGDQGVAGLRGSQQYFGSGAPSNDLSTFNPPAQPRDTFLDQTTAGGPYLYVLGS